MPAGNSAATSSAWVLAQFPPPLSSAAGIPRLALWLKMKLDIIKPHRVAGVGAVEVNLR